MYPKFIIETIDETDKFILGKVQFHYMLVQEDKENVKGGGWYHYNEDTNTFTLSDKSHEFGYAKEEDIKNCIDDNEVNQKIGNSIRSMNDHTFKYNNQCEIITLKNYEK